MDPMSQVDPMLLLTLAGLALGFATGGTIEGGGAQVGARIPLGAEGIGPVEVGVNPIVHMSSKGLPGGLDGITLGGTTVAVRPDVWVTTRSAAYSPDNWFRRTTDYEYGHVPGWAHFGLAYALKSQAEPSKYDPATLSLAMDRRSTSREVNPWELDPKHFAVKLVLDTLTREVTNGNR